MADIYDSTANLPSDLLSTCRDMPLPARLLMCPPEYFDIVDVKNPFMEGHMGDVNFTAVEEQWNAVRNGFEQAGATVELIDPLENCEDMVFCANQTLAGLDDEGNRLCILSQMTHESRQREVPAFGRWFEGNEYQVVHLPGDERFEGSGDALWHPGRGLLWGGYGHRTEPEAYEAVGELFDVPVLRLRLISDTFYHLDTSFCAIDEKTVLIYPPAFEAAGLELIRSVFENVIECPPSEALDGMACNATAIGGRHVVIQRGNTQTVKLLRDRNYQIYEVDTSEFMKSGGSVFCLKMYVF